MKVMHSEWTDRLHHWIRTLKDDFYEPLGEIAWEAFRTKEHRTPEEVAQHPESYTGKYLKAVLG